MKINGSQINRAVNLYKAQEKDIENVKDKVPAKKDEVILSKEAQELQAAFKNGQGSRKADATRAKRVENIKSQIKKGEYSVDSKKVASKMIENALFDKRV